MESYRDIMKWNHYKHSLVRDIVHTRSVRYTPQFRPPERALTQYGDLATSFSSGKQRGDRTQDRGKSAKEKKEKSEKEEGKEDKKEKDTKSEGDGERPKEGVDGAISEDKKTSDGVDKDETPPRIFPVIEVDLYSNTPTPREEEEYQREKNEDKPVETDAALTTDGGLGGSSSPESPGPTPPFAAILQRSATDSAPSAVIVRRRSSLGVNSRPISLAHDATIVNRHRKSHNELHDQGKFAAFSLAEVEDQND
jgi:hypothetical protein